MTDMNRCPQTDEEMRDYFFALIGRTLGSPANDYEAVLSTAYPWQGQPLMIPAGVGPGVKLPPDAPFFGLTQQFSGVPKGRVFLPPLTPDSEGYYTRCDQYLDDAVQTYTAAAKYGHGKPHPDFAAVKSSGAGLVWSWYYVAGNAYAPLLPADGNGKQPVSGITEEQCQPMIDAAVAPLTSQIAELQTAMAAPLRAHGPVNLPIVVESLTSMRAKGDIDVQVLPGTATPPADTSGGDEIAGAKLLLWLRHRQPDEA